MRRNVRRLNREMGNVNNNNNNNNNNSVNNAASANMGGARTFPASSSNIITHDTGSLSDSSGGRTSRSPDSTSDCSSETNSYVNNSQNIISGPIVMEGTHYKFILIEISLINLLTSFY